MLRRRHAGVILAIAVGCLLSSTLAAEAQPAAGAKKPNILVIWGDDIGWYNISAYNLGVMGYKTTNIDRIAREGALFTDWYGQQSCTAGRAAFITGQSPIRTGLTKVGLPGAPEGLTAADPTIADLLKAQGYTTGQFGKNHLGDRNEHIPTVHGFDEFYGNFYHLNAEEEPENPDYPKDPSFKAKFGPRGVLKCTATTSASTLPDDARFGAWGRQNCTDTGPLTRKRMETVDYDVTDNAIDFIKRANAANKPFFVWWNSTRMHIWTHLRPEADNKTGLGVYPDGMVEHDGHVGQLLKALDDLGIANNTIVMYSTDNGAEAMSWPDGGTTPFHGEKNTNWEGGYRVPMAMRWPGVIKPGTVINDIGSHEDMLPTFYAAATGTTDIAAKLRAGLTAGGRTFKVHLDGYDWGPYLHGQGTAAPRRDFIYWTDGGQIAGLRYDQWKMVFMEQRAEGFEVWAEPLVTTRVPKIINLRADPFERAQHEGMGYKRYWIDRVYLLVPAQTFVARWLTSFKEYPPRMKPASFSLDQVMTQMATAGGSR
jgi:arylsulfatase A-like enzyme